MGFYGGVPMLFISHIYRRTSRSFTLSGLLQFQQVHYQNDRCDENTEYWGSELLGFIIIFCSPATLWCVRRPITLYECDYAMLFILCQNTV